MRVFLARMPFGLVLLESYDEAGARYEALRQWNLEPEWIRLCPKLRA